MKPDRLLLPLAIVFILSMAAINLPSKNQSAATLNPVNAAGGSYQVSGNVIRDPSGAVFTPHGVDRPSLEWGCNGTAVGGGSGIPAADFTTMHTTWGSNSVRIALDQDFWLPGAARYCPGYQATVKAAVSAARQSGQVVILDLHWSDQGSLATAKPGQQCMADQNSATFWQQVASVYKGDSGVWFELYNEPHDISWSNWLTGGPACNFQTVGMQALYNEVRATGATNIVVATGNGWGSHLDGVPLLAGNNIAYAIHPYANQTSPTAWSDIDWNNRFGYLTPKAPVIATEFGKYQCGEDSYDQAILDFFRTHGVGYTAWAWYAGGCSFPSLISDSNGTCANGGCVTQKDMRGFANGSLKMVIPGQTGSPGSTDLNGDGVTNIFDLSIFLGHWQQTGRAIPEDFNQDGVVNIIDLSALLSHF